MILYFSATGNGKYISEQIAERTNETCMSIVDCIREDKYSFYDEEIIGIVVPTYFWRLPRIVAEYLDKSERKLRIYIFSCQLWDNDW